jgi:hypothetical protein
VRPRIGHHAFLYGPTVCLHTGGLYGDARWCVGTDGGHLRLRHCHLHLHRRDVEDGDDGLGDEDSDELEPEDGDVDETDPESVRAEIERLQAVLDDLEGGEDGDELGDEDGDELGDEDGDEIEPEGGEGDELGDEGDGIEPDGEEGDELEPEGEDGEGLGDEEPEQLDEAKLAVLNRLARKVAANILLKEETLHDFGNHPGYRKQPVELPETGEDQNEHGKDWNDDSVHGEEPFGQSKGDSKPYSNTLERDALAMKITDKVMESLKKRG